MRFKNYIPLLAIVSGIRIANAQYNYVAFDQFVFQFGQPQQKNNSNTFSESVMKSTGDHCGASFHFPIGRMSAVSVGTGLTTLNYEKQWLGNFRENGQLGIVTVKGSIQYWSFPVSVKLFRYSGKIYGCHGQVGKTWQFGMNVSYIPSFEGKSTYSIHAFGSADSSSFVAGFHSNEQAFQHSLAIGLSNRFLLFRGKMFLELQPYCGIGSGYFKDSGIKLNTFSYGVRFQIGVRIRMPRITVVRETNGNYNEKKKQLEQKQKEIEQQLNKPQ